MGRHLTVFIIALAAVFAACAEEKEMAKSLTVKSAFENGGKIPAKYTCDGEDISPPLYIEGLREDVKSLVIICEDPDAPMGVFTHWIAWNVEPTSEIPENVPKTKFVDEPKMVQGRNDFGKVGYNGPCPPSGGTGITSGFTQLTPFCRGITAGRNCCVPLKGTFCSTAKFTAFTAEADKLNQNSTRIGI